MLYFVHERQKRNGLCGFRMLTSDEIRDVLVGFRYGSPLILESFSTTNISRKILSMFLCNMPL